MSDIITKTNIWSGLLKENLPGLLARTMVHYPYVWSFITGASWASNASEKYKAQQR